MPHMKFLASRTAIRTALVVAMLAAAGAGIAPQAALAADDYSPGNASSGGLGPARDLIAAKKWESAIEELRRVNDTGSADWNNLMGYALRKQPTPDLANAEKHYNAALRIDPKHKRALEYSGELYLMKGDLATAEQRLASLDKACFLPCTEYNELKQAIARFKSGQSPQAGK